METLEVYKNVLFVEKKLTKKGFVFRAKGLKNAQRHYGANLEKKKKRGGKGRGWNGMIRYAGEVKKRKERGGRDGREE